MHPPLKGQGNMTQVTFVLLLIGVSFLCIALILSCHHKYKHSRNNEHYLPLDEQWFQQEDVCVAKCTHENWIVACLGLGLFTLWAAAVFAIST